ncbi:Dihydrofolate synthase @ Folylpolyglutamate synthase, partial [hydrothermal vent metagenome]
MSEHPPAGNQTPAVPDNPAPKPKPLRARRFVSYESALKYLDSHTNIERSRPSRIERGMFKLDRIRAMFEELQNPHHQVRFVHVAGSKGKGSIVEMIASSLGECGYGVGVYTSPHLTHVRERARIGTEPISKTDFVRELGFVAVAAAAVEKIHGKATYFELITAMAFRYFAERAVDVAVIEVGLGGRLDSTNVITPECGVIGAIHLEHTQILGETIEEIAREKAGTMKPGVTTFTYAQSEAVMGVFRQVAEEVGADLKVIGEDIDFTWRFESTAE